MTRCALLVLAAGLLVAAEDAKDDASANDVKKLQGAWVLSSGVDDGKKLSDDKLKGARLTVMGDKHTVQEGGKTYKGTHKLDASKKPKTIDITDTAGPFKGKTVLGIYTLDGDEFRLCYALPGKDRPTDFSAPAGSGHRSHVWKREKK
jgi:uncharacterized protein (TIGR03067 family)